MINVMAKGMNHPFIWQTSFETIPNFPKQTCDKHVITPQRM